MLFNIIISVLTALFLLTGGAIVDASEASIVHSEKHPGGTVHTLSTGLQLLELFHGTDKSLPALNTTHLIELRKADPAARLPTIPGVPLPKREEVNSSKAPPYFGAHKCLTKSTSPLAQYSINNGNDIAALGNAWCCAHGIYYPWGGACTIMNTNWNAKAVICKAMGDGPGAMCAPCWAAGGGILEIASLCKDGLQAEGVIQ
jgi:hypothetical protein